MVMLQAKISELKARLSAHLRAVRAGETVIIYDRSTPVAQLIPYPAAGDGLTVRPPSRALASVSAPPPSTVDPAALQAAIDEERQTDR